MHRVYSFIKQYFDEISLIGLSIFLFFVASNTQSGWLYFVISFIVGMLVLSLISSILNLRNVKIHRSYANIVKEDEKVKVTLRVINKNWYPLFFLLIEDEFPALFPTDKKPNILIPYIPPYESKKVTYLRRAYKRGVYEFKDIKITSAGLVGFFTLSKNIKMHLEKITVLPSTFNIKSFLPRNASPYSAFGQKTHNFMGNSDDFAGIREYIPGHEVRFIHWPSTAKYSTLMIKEFNETSTHSISVLIDTLQGSDIGRGRDTTLEYAIKMASSLLKESVKKRYSYDLYIPTRKTLYTAKHLNAKEGYIRLAHIQANAEIPLEKHIPHIASQLDPIGYLFIFKIFPFESIEELILLSKLKISTTVIFIYPPSFDSEKYIVEEDVYLSQIKTLQSNNIRACLYKKEGKLPPIFKHL